MRKSLCNNTLQIYIGVCRTCISCGLTEEWKYDLESTQRTIISSVKNDGWSVGGHGLKCPECAAKYRKKKEREE